MDPWFGRLVKQDGCCFDRKVMMEKRALMILVKKEVEMANLKVRLVLEKKQELVRLETREVELKLLKSILKKRENRNILAAAVQTSRQKLGFLQDGKAYPGTLVIVRTHTAAGHRT